MPWLESMSMAAIRIAPAATCARPVPQSQRWPSGPLRLRRLRSGTVDGSRGSPARRIVPIKEVRMAENKTEIARREERGVARSEPFFEPFRMMDRFVDEMARVCEDVFGRGRLKPRPGRTTFGSR